MPWPITAYDYGSYQYLMREVAMYLGLSPDQALWDTDQAAVIDAIVQRGVRRFYNPPRLPGERQAHQWTFLRPLATLTTVAPYSTGTVTIVAGVVTLAGVGAAFPSDGAVLAAEDAADASIDALGQAYAAAALWELTVDGETHRVNARGGNTQVTLSDTSVAEAAGSTYELTFNAFALPAYFAMLDGPLTFRPGVTQMYRPIEIVSEHQIRTKRSAVNTTGRPQLAAIYPQTPNLTIGTRYLIQFYPTPDDEYELTFRYRANPGLLTSSNKMPLGGDPHAQTWVASVLYEAEIYRRKPGVQRDLFYEALASSIDHDRQVNSPDFLGYNGDRSDRPLDGGCYGYHDCDENIITYNGVTY